MTTNRKIREKLNTRGASMIIALLIFIIVTFVSIAIVNASILNAKRTDAERYEEKAYLATTQAIALVQGCMKEDAAYTKKEGKDSELTGLEGSFGDAVKQMADSITGGSDSVTRNISFSYSGLDDMGSLSGQMTMDDSYTITVDVWVDSDKADYPLTLTIPGSAQTVKQEIPGRKNKGKTKRITYVSWSKDGMYVTGTDNG
ncbi:MULTISPECIES: hypothetical protein [unclassified Butyrivibrio]|uniref:hypothetical protein n=1 Tax=unclassified Butyrivibrio TaxID=2639466 RepID=UPI0003B675D8|nr:MULTISPECIES: hypothetical protein [unclassified Butyrivibrio]SEK92755.1 hypothetical protein SAMN04487770_10486 [Butyrivibrio sp. ob235]